MSEINGSFRGALRTLSRDGQPLWTVGTLFLFLLVGAWAAWFILAEVPVRAVSLVARLEVDRAAHPVDAPVGGRVVVNHLALGRLVRKGDVLVELDSHLLRLQQQEAVMRRKSAESQIALLHDEVRFGTAALNQFKEGTRQAVKESEARRREIEALSHFAREKSLQIKGLTSQGLVSRLDGLAATAESERRTAEATRLQLAIERITFHGRTSLKDRLASLQRLRRQAALLEGEVLVARTSIERINYEIARRRVEAPADGSLGEVATIRPGTVLREGERVAVVVPAGRVRIVAQFPPATSLGRIRPGQSVRMQLDGFPWTQYGFLEGRVTAMGSEIRLDRVRVEAEVYRSATVKIPLQHGLPGIMRVDVERATPLALTIRAAGRMLRSKDAL